MKQREPGSFNVRDPVHVVGIIVFMVIIIAIIAEVAGKV